MIYFVLIRFLSGALAHSGYAQSVSKEVQANVPVTQRTFANGILLSSSGIASILGPIFVSPAVQNLGYKQTYIILTVIALVIGLILVVVIPNSGNVQKTNSDKKMLIKFHLVKYYLIKSSGFCLSVIFSLTQSCMA